MWAYNNVDAKAHVVAALHEFCENNALELSSLDKITCVVDDANYALVPTEFFSQEQASTYLSFCNGREGDRVISEHVAAADCVVVYGINEEFLKSLNDMLPRMELRHSAAVLVGNILSHNKGLTQYVNVRQSDYDILVADGDKLLFCNSFRFNGVDDFVYYIVSVMRQYGSPEDVELCFCGMVMPDSEVMRLVDRYVRKVRFLDSSMLPDDLEAPRHHYYVPLDTIPV